MKHIFYRASLLVLILLTTFSDCVSQHNLWEDPHWKLAWEDHFNGNSLDNTKWLAANYAVHGKELKSFDIENKGDGYVSIQGADFMSGMYLYALIVDDKIVDTKRMILTNK